MLIGNRSQIRAFNEAVKSSPFKICICGPSGCGKTTLAKSILKNFKTLENPKEVASAKEFIETNSNTLIFIDDIDIDYIKLASKFANLNTNVLFTCLEKRHVPKNMQIIKLEYPRVNEAFPYLLDKLPAATTDPDVLLETTRLYKGNIREILLNMDFKQNNYSFFKNMTDFEIAKQLLISPGTGTGTGAGAAPAELIPFLMYENFGQVYGDDNFELYEKLNDHFVASIKSPFGNDIRLRAFLTSIKTQPKKEYTKFRFPQLFYLK